MKKIFQIYLADLKRISTNVVAIVIIMGLCIIPALYAWFNIMSNWDPYGEGATSQMHIAVYSEDEGMSVGDLKLCMGDSVIKGLKENNAIGWIFTDSSKEALEYVYSGKCYAAFIVPKDFSADMLSFLSGEPVNPQIEYYENSKKNAIATKITSKVKTTVQQSVNSSMVSTITEIASKSGELIVGDGKSGDNLTGTVVDKLKDMDTTLSTYAGMLDTFAMLTESADSLIGSTQSLLPSVQGLIDGGQSSVSGMQSSVLSGAQTAQTITQMVDISLSNINSQLDVLENSIQLLNASGLADADTADISVSVAGFDTVEQLAENTLSAIQGLKGVDSSQIEAVRNNIQSIKTQIKDLKSDTELTADKLKLLKESIKADVSGAKSAIDTLKNTFDHSVSPNLTGAVYDIEYALIETQSMLGSLDNSFPDIQKALDDYSAVLKSGNADIVNTRQYVQQIRDGLQNVISGFDNLSNDEQFNEIVKLLRTDPTLIAQFVTSPLSMDEQKIYEISTYGSAMAPFYTVLALWVGGLITVALVKTKVKDTDDIKSLGKVNSVHKFFGRYITFFVIGQLQTLVTVLGDLFFVGIQCRHPFLFWCASALTSLVFTLLMYSLTAAWGNVGQAVAVVIMVIQVAGAGGTFPVEVLPQVYRALYKFMPFNYAMNALRECVGGMYRFDYCKDLAILLIFIAISLVIGLLLGRPFGKLNTAIEKSKKKSGLIL